MDLQQSALEDCKNLHLETLDMIQRAVETIKERGQTLRFSEAARYSARVDGVEEIEKSHLRELGRLLDTLKDLERARSPERQIEEIQACVEDTLADKAFWPQVEKSKGLGPMVEEETGDLGPLRPGAEIGEMGKARSDEGPPSQDTYF